MKVLHTNFGRAVVGVSALSWLLMTPVAMGAAAHDESGDVDVTNTETIQIYTDASGKVDTKRIYEQLVLTGNGDVDLENPVSTDGLRNLDGFSGVDVEDGSQLISTSVDGQKRMRTVSDFNGTIPLDVSVTYLLDGEEIQPDDLVGESGDLEVKYHVENVTGQMQEVEVDDGMGGTVTRDIEVVLPMVGSLSTLLPSNFTDVQSDQANIAGDGRGATKMSFTMTLFPPIGAPTADFGYTAKITDGLIPRATISALPVNPLESPSFKGGAESYQGGSETGADLTAGATEIDANLLKLRDGAADLSLGLMKLYDGAGRLSAGLNDEAVPGTEKLADGSSQLSDGADRLFMGSGDLVEGMVKLEDGTVQLSDGADRVNDGAGDVADGASRLHDGVRTARNGASDLHDGARKLENGAVRLAAGQSSLSAGLKQLYDGVDQLPASVRQQLKNNPDYVRLLGTLDTIVTGVGEIGDAPTKETLLGAVNAIEYGMRYPVPPANLDCNVALSGQVPVRCGALDGVDFIASQLTQGATDLNQLKSAIAPLLAANSCAMLDPNTPAPPANQTGLCVAVTNIWYGLYSPSPTAPGAQAKVGLAANNLRGITSKVDGQLLDNDGDPALEGLPKLRRVLSNGNAQTCNRTDPSAPNACGIKEALTIIRAGVPLLVDTLTTQISTELNAKIGVPTAGCNPKKTLRCAAAALADGGADLADGTVKLADGTKRLADGTIVLADGTKRLADGTIKLSDGAQKLAAGAGDLKDGAGQLEDGGVRLHDGASQLADGSTQIEGGLTTLLDGLVDAAAGSGQLRSGLHKAADGAPQIEEGASKLSKKGTQKLIDAGSDTTVTFGVKYAQIKAGADRAQTESMAYGAPAGAHGQTAYTYEIRGEDGEGGRNWTRGIAALALFGLGAGAVLLRRRLL